MLKIYLRQRSVSSANSLPLSPAALALLKKYFEKRPFLQFLEHPDQTSTGVTDRTPKETALYVAVTNLERCSLYRY
jgi:hypothetical protein